MTHEETKQAIAGITEFFKGITGNQNLEIPSEIAEKYGIQAQADRKYISVDTVIEWLKEKDIIKMSWQEDNARKELEKLEGVAIPSVEPTTDELKEALRELKQEYNHHQYNNSDRCYGWSTSFKQAVAVAIKCLSAEPKTGHWQHYEGMLICSECGTEFYDDIMEYCGDDVPKCCPKCGCRMVDEQERSDKQ